MYALYVGLICTPYMLAMKRAQILALYVCLYTLALYAGVEQQVLALSGQRKLMVVCLMCMPYMYALCVCLISGVGTLKAEKTDIFIEKSDGCMPYMYALHVCHMCMPYMYALCVCLLCMPYVYVISVCDIFIEKSDGCIPYMYALCVCLMCMPYIRCWHSRLRILSSLPSRSVLSLAQHTYTHT